MCFRLWKNRLLDRGAIAFDEFQENENNRNFMAHSERWEICDDLRMATNNYYSASQESHKFIG